MPIKLHESFRTSILRSGPVSFSVSIGEPTTLRRKVNLWWVWNGGIQWAHPHLPAVFTIAVLRGFGAPVPLIFFAGRFVTLLAFVGVFYLAIRLIPTGKQALFVSGLASHYARNGIFVLCRSYDHLFGGAGHQSYAEVTPV